MATRAHTGRSAGWDQISGEILAAKGRGQKWGVDGLELAFKTRDGRDCGRLALPELGHHGERGIVEAHYLR